MYSDLEFCSKRLKTDLHKNKSETHANGIDLKHVGIRTGGN